jgi:hypothetical protein
MTERAPVFDKIMKDYLRQVALIEAKEKIGASLGITVMTDGNTGGAFASRTA